MRLLESVFLAAVVLYGIHHTQNKKTKLDLK